MCLEWFKDEKDLTEHMAHHIELSTQEQHLKSTEKLEVLSPEDLVTTLFSFFFFFVADADGK